jgi:hypothetical protein
MALETGTYISDLNVLNPVATDPKAQGDDHLRLIKSTVKNTFPQLTGPVNANQAEINRLVGITSPVVGTTETQTLTNKTVSLTSNTLTGTTAEFNAALSDGDFATLAGTQTLTNKTISGASNTITQDGTNAVGFLAVPQNSKSAAYTLVLADAGKHILHPSADTTARTFTIPANSSVAFPVGTAVSFINQNGAGTITISITTDTMRLAGAGTTGSRTLAANGIATAVKITTTEWIISGSGLS